MQLRPGTIAALAGGALLFVSTFLDWFGFAGFGESVLNGDLFGFSGIILLLLSLAAIALTAIPAFAPQVALPSEVIGFTRNQLVMIIGFASFVYAFGLMFIPNSKFGSILAWIGAAAIVVGAFLEDKAAPSADAGPPRTF